MADRVCGKCGKLNVEKVVATVATLVDSQQESKTESALCPECQKKFKAWMTEKHYLATDCWCGHIDEFRAVSDA